MPRHLPRHVPAARFESPIVVLPWVLVSALILCGALYAAPARAAFHLNEITKVMVGYNGDSTVQAVELKMLTSLENAVTDVSIKTYNAGGTPLEILGTFAGGVGSGMAGRKILCATPNFATTFGITPDLEITPGIPVITGQVSFEKGGLYPCLVNAIPYGAVTAPKNGTTAAPPLPADGATVLVRVVDDPTTTSCPLQENANANFRLVSGSSGSPVTFTNNANTSVNVFTTVTGVDGNPPAPPALHASPNPFRGNTQIVTPGWEYLAIYDVRGRLVRAYRSRVVTPRVLGPRQVTWDGTDTEDRRVPSGIYFAQYGQSPAQRIRLVLLR